MKRIYIKNGEIFNKPLLNPVFVDKDSLAKFTKISPTELTSTGWLSLFWSLFWRSFVFFLLSIVATVFIVGLITLGYYQLAVFFKIPETVIQFRLFLVTIVIFISAFFAGQIMFMHWMLSNAFGKYHMWLVEKNNSKI